MRKYLAFRSLKKFSMTTHGSDKIKMHYASSRAVKSTWFKNHYLQIHFTSRRIYPIKPQKSQMTARSCIRKTNDKLQETITYYDKTKQSHEALHNSQTYLQRYRMTARTSLEAQLINC